MEYYVAYRQHERKIQGQNKYAPNYPNFKMPREDYNSPAKQSAI
jgi:hypothetical protein